MSYRDLSDRLAATWWYPLLIAAGLALVLLSVASNLAQGRWTRALFSIFPLAFLAREMHRVWQARLPPR
jgi:hypothetical protein